MAPLGVHDLLKIRIDRENAKIANIFCNMIQLNSCCFWQRFICFFFLIEKKVKICIFIQKWLATEDGMS